VTSRLSTTDFSKLFDRAVAACAAAQTLSSQAWALADLVYTDMRSEVERVAVTLRNAGMDKSTASATIRAHIRFVLYDGGLPEQAAEPVVARASSWVDSIYAAA
jgi:hypothetical protein